VIMIRQLRMKLVVNSLESPNFQRAHIVFTITVYSHISIARDYVRARYGACDQRHSLELQLAAPQLAPLCTSSTSAATAAATKLSISPRHVHSAVTRLRVQTPVRTSALYIIFPAAKPQHLPERKHWLQPSASAAHSFCSCFCYCYVLIKPFAFWIQSKADAKYVRPPCTFPDVPLAVL
jgi:hypothetical protein